MECATFRLVIKYVIRESYFAIKHFEILSYLAAFFVVNPGFDYPEADLGLWDKVGVEKVVVGFAGPLLMMCCPVK